MNLKRVLSILVCGLLACSLIACSSSGSSSTAEPTQAPAADDGAAVVDDGGEAPAPAADSDVHIAVIFKTLSAEYWKTMEAGSRQAAADLGITVTVLGPNAESEIAQQVTQIEEQLSAGVDAIVVAPCEENAVIGALSPAVGNLPVLLVDTDAGLEGKTAFIGTGNANAAKLGGVYAAEVIGAGGKAILIGGQQGEATSAQRLDGFRAGLEENGVEVLEEQFGQNTADRAMAVMEDLLTKYPGEIDAILAMNDDMAMGVQMACQNSGIEDITIVGFNADAGALELIKEGKIAATVAQQPYVMGYQCVEEAYKAAIGESIEAHQDVPANLVTIDNVDEYLQ